MHKVAICAACALALVAGQAPQPDFSPARFRDGNGPAVPIAAVSGGEVFVELQVDASGEVIAATPFRVTPPFTSAVVEALAGWRFFPAREAVGNGAAGLGEASPRVAVPSSVFVAAVFRPPVLAGPTLGEPPKDVASPSAAVPVPTVTTTPAFPPMTMSSGSVLLEVQVDTEGAVADVGVIQSFPPFDEPAIAAVREWRFRPARVHGDVTSSVAYVVLGFRLPVGGSVDPLIHRPLLKGDRARAVNQ